MKLTLTRETIPYTLQICQLKAKLTYCRSNELYLSPHQLLTFSIQEYNYAR